MSLYWDDFEAGRRSPTYGRTVTEGLFRDTVLALLGVDNGRFLGPVRAGDTIRTEVEVLSKRETKHPDRGIVVFRDHVLNQRDEVVFQIDKTTLIRRRGKTA